MIRAIVTDIEGTTSSLAFVKEVLFPYARAHLREYILDHDEDPVVIEQLEAVRAIVREGQVPVPVNISVMAPSLEETAAILEQWIEERSQADAAEGPAGPGLGTGLPSQGFFRPCLCRCRKGTAGLA